VITDPAAVALLQRRQVSKAVELLLGMVTGIIADENLHDMEIRLLRSWLADNQDVASTWPGSVIARNIEAVLADGVISEQERSHLLQTLKTLAINDFSHTGSAEAEVVGLPYSDQDAVSIERSGICHTGVFLHGTREACERLTQAAGGIILPAVSRKAHFLVIGTNVSPNWAQTSYGRKIQQAMQLQQAGHAIRVISERRWLQAVAT